MNRLSAALPLLSLLFASCLFTPLAASQTTNGLPPFSTVDAGLYDDIKINDAAVLLTLPVRSKAGLIPFSYSLILNPNVGETSQLFENIPSSRWSATTSAGLSTSIEAGFTTQTGGTCNGQQNQTVYTGFQIVDGFGAVHPISNIRVCAGQSYGLVAPDGSGYAAGGTNAGGVPVGVSDRAGNEVTLNPGTTKTLTDPNGNQLSVNTVNTVCPMSCSVGQSFTSTTTYTDTTGLVSMTETATFTAEPPNAFLYLTKDVHSWTDAGGNTQSYTINYSSYQQKTNFGCYIPADLSSVSTSFLPSSITAPDGIYTITYEPTPGFSGDVTGRIQKIVLPSGASLSYTYTGSNNGLGCRMQTANSSPQLSEMVPVLSRTLTDAKGVQRVWKYDTTQATNETVVTDPAGNDTVYLFYTGSTGNGSTIMAKSPLETQRQIYQGSHSSGTLLKTVLTCYNGNTSNCANPNPGGTISVLLPASVAQKDVYTTLAGMTQSSHSQTTYDVYGNLKEDKEYDFTGTLISDRVLTYGTYSNGSCSAIANANILNHVCTDVTKDGSGNVLSQTNNTYDSHGNLTSTAKLVGGTTYITSGATYNTNGTMNVATDVNGAQTTYSSYACNGNFPATINEPLSLSRLMTWDCNGGVMTSATDENSQKTNYTFTSGKTADPFYRPLSMTDPLNNVTNYTYTATTFESAMNFNGTVSTVDSLTTTDGFGHTILSQTRQGQGSSSFDTIQYGFDADFRFSSTSMPCVAAAGKGCSTATTTTTYDGANRPLQVTDGGGGTTTYSYAPGSSQNNDVLITQGPAPSGENTKRRQVEYDGLGRLTSVCELTGTANGGGSCAQNAAQTGYWTQYAYDGLNRLTSVSQGSQSAHPQARSYSYDSLGRLTSEINPESGTSAYTYDSDSTCGNSSGDLVKKVDAVGNVNCYAYDLLHRKTGVKYPSGPYAPNTPAKTFVYDSTSVSCTPNPAYPNGAYVKGRLAEAYTGSSTAKTTDISYCYSPRGETTDVFETTPNSAGTYHTTGTYWANGALNTLTGVPGLNGWTFTPDGEGRSYSATYGTSTNWVTKTSYYPTNASNPPNTTVTFGNGDTDVYGFDATTGRMNSFKFSVGSTPTTLSGTPGWNKNGTLGTLAITDQFNSGNTQNCTYVYDDLARIQSVSCTNGSTNVFSQTFTIDPFGNVSKSGSSSFAATYVLSNGTTNNQEQTVGSCVPTYDANGDMTKDCSFASPPNYVWDSDGNAITLRNGVNLTYDALDREVEFANSSGPVEILYTPIGKLGKMGGQSAKAIRIPLPGGSTVALYGPTGGSVDVLHTDWLGSSRLATGYGNRTMDYDTSYAPYGESYASAGSATSDLDFTGQFQDTMSGLYDFLNREYDPVQGRWISPDPSGLNAVAPNNPQTWNRYAYVLNNPLSYTDPSGLWCVWEDGTHDDDESDGGVGLAACRAAGGHWDTFDTITGILQDGNGIVTQINYIGGGVCTSANCGAGATLEQFDKTLNSYSVVPSQPSWLWSFTTSFFSFAGGPGNIPTCAGQTLRNIGDELAGGDPTTSQAAETSFKAASAIQAGRALNYAANRTNTLGGTGLICPECSSTFRSMMSKSEVLGEAAEGVALVDVSYAAGKSIPDVSAQARAGTCAAAFPVF